MSLLDDINNGNVAVYTDEYGRRFVMQTSGFDGVPVYLDDILKQASPANSYSEQAKGLLGQWSSFVGNPFVGNTQVQQYLSQIDTPEELAYMQAKFDPTKVPHLEELTYQLAGFGNQQNVDTWLKQQAGQPTTALENMLIDNPGMAGQSVVRPDIPDLYQGVANPNAADGGPAYTQAMYDKYGVTEADYNQAATDWATNNTAAAQAARDDDDGFGDLLTIAALGAGLYFGLPALFGEAGAGTLGAIGDAGYLNTLGEWGSMAAPSTGTLGSIGATTAGVNAAVPSIVSAPATGGLTLADLAPTAAGTATAGGVSPAIATAAGVPSVTGATAGLMGLDPAIAAAAGVPSVAGGLATGTSVLAGAAPGAALTTAQLAGVTVPDVVPAAATAAAKAATAAAKDDGLTDTGSIMPYVTSAGLNLAGGLLSADAASDAADKQAATQLAIADMMRFRPVGVTTRFGSSQFGYDPATGNLTSAGYTLSPEVKALQDSLMEAAPGLLSQFTGAQAATAPMGTAAQAAMNLGNQYLTTSPQEQAAKYMAEQMALLQPYNERNLSNLEAKLQAQGRLGLATGGTSTLGASNPELEALYNAQKMQQLQLAAAATQGGMDYAKFGTGMVGAGGDLLNSMYGTQVAAFNPYNTALTGANTLEGMGQQAMNIGTTLGAQQTTANTPAANLMGQAAATQAAGNAVSPWGALLSGAGNAIQNYQTQQQQAATAQQQYQGLLSAITNGLSNWKP